MYTMRACYYVTFPVSHRACCQGVARDTTSRFLTWYGPGRGDVTGSDLVARRVTGLDLACECNGADDGRSSWLLLICFFFFD